MFHVFADAATETVHVSPPPPPRSDTPTGSAGGEGSGSQSSRSRVDETPPGGSQSSRFSDRGEGDDCPYIEFDEHNPDVTWEGKPVMFVLSSTE